MRFLPFLLVCAVAIFANACERHPLPGDPHPAKKESEGHGPANFTEGGADIPDDKPAMHPVVEAPKPPVPPLQTEEAPKFFPEKK